MLASRQQELQRLQTERTQLLSRIAERDAKVRVLEGRVAKLEKRPDTILSRRIAELEGRSRELNDELNKARAMVRELQRELASRKPAHDDSTEERARLAARIAQLERELEQARASAPQAQGDDLTQLKGVGPRFAERLRAIGISGFTQIAAWTEEDVQRVARQLRIPQARIRRDGWIESAKRLAGDS